MSVSVKNISRLFGRQRALDDVSFDVGRGQIVGFLGPNGAGKSTMMKILTGFIPPSSGVAMVCGIDVEENTKEVKRNIGYLPEHNPLYLEMYVREHLEFIGGLHKIDNKKARVADMIDIVGLGSERHKKIGALSKGYRQRVGLAQALIHKPSVLILDEPTSGLDPNQIIEIRNLIKEAGKEKTVLMSTHIMQEAEAICDKVIIINKGKIIADDKTQNIRDLLHSSGFIEVEFSSNVDGEELRALEGVEEVLRLSETLWKLTGASGKDLREEIFRFAVKNNNSVLTLHKKDSSLEDVFKELTKEEK